MCVINCLISSVAAQLLRGMPVIPEIFENVTIGFTDIVGFQNMVFYLMPLQVFISNGLLYLNSKGVTIWQNELCQVENTVVYKLQNYSLFANGICDAYFSTKWLGRGAIGLTLSMYMCQLWLQFFQKYENFSSHINKKKGLSLSG